MVSPKYPSVARSLNLQGAVTVEIIIDEKGKVISAKATDGAVLLRTSSEEAAKESKFKPALFNNKPIKSKGYLIYNYVL